MKGYTDCTFPINQIIFQDFLPSDLVYQERTSADLNEVETVKITWRVFYITQFTTEFTHNLHIGQYLQTYYNF